MIFFGIRTVTHTREGEMVYGRVVSGSPRGQDAWHRVIDETIVEGRAVVPYRPPYGCLP